MRLNRPGLEPRWLAYGMNVHPGGGARTATEALGGVVAPLRRRLGLGEAPVGVAVRFSAEGVRELLEDPSALGAWRDALAEQHALPFTGNAFVVGDFHGVGIKEGVYAPPWGDPVRSEYTLAFATLLARSVPPGTRVSLSTAPGTWKAWPDAREVDGRAQAVASVGDGLRHLYEETGVDVRLGLEPEPGCTLETTDDVIAFFDGPMQRAWSKRGDAGRRHVGVCFDVCHQAVRFESPSASLASLARAHIPIVKVQLSIALHVPATEEARRDVAAFNEATYLHQTTRRLGSGEIALHADLPDALADPAWHDASPWRVHFHLPVFLSRVGAALRTTRAELTDALLWLRDAPDVDHLEIETYTYGVLPRGAAATDDASLVDALAREYAFVLAALGADAALGTPDA